jgi:uncharacterized tellurite resistance protein B-like protein
MDTSTARYLEALAFVLTRVAEADRRLPEAEVREMERILVEEAGLDLELAVLVVEIARHRRAIADCATAYRASRRLRESRDRDRLLECLVAVAAADGELHRDEMAAILQVAVELGLSARDVRTIVDRSRRSL